MVNPLIHETRARRQGATSLKHRNFVQPFQGLGHVKFSPDCLYPFPASSLQGESKQTYLLKNYVGKDINVAFLSLLNESYKKQLSSQKE